MLSDSAKYTYRTGAKIPRDVHDSISLANRCVSNGSARCYLLHGVLRRVMMIDYCLQRIEQETPPAGSASLTPDKATMLAVYLNAFYINVRGTLDNLAWLLYYELQLDKENPSLTSARKQSIGLAQDAFLRALSKKGRVWEHCAQALANEPRKQWMIELATKRDPAAHRLPIEVPPGGVPEEKEAEYRGLIKLMETAPVEEIYGLCCQAENLEHFEPCMFIEDAEGPNRVTWPLKEVYGDAEQLFDVVRTVVASLSGSKATTL